MKSEVSGSGGRITETQHYSNLLRSIWYLKLNREIWEVALRTPTDLSEKALIQWLNKHSANFTLNSAVAI